MRKTNSSLKHNLVVIGNGFDLACGEKTKILDFIEWLYEQPNNSFSLYQINFIAWIIHNICCSDDWHEWRCFFGFEEIEFDNWMDFEKVINQFVLNDSLFERMSDLFDKRYLYKKQTDNIYAHALALYFDNCREWHKGLYDISDSYLDFLEKSIQEFENQLCQYLRLIDDDRNVYAKKELLLQELNSGYEKTLVMDFNYTKIPNNPFSHPAYYIHGNIRTGCFVGIDPYYKKPGVNDLYKSLGQKIRFTKVYKRLKYSSSQEIQQVVLKKTINRITFFGHSLGEQDYSYFQSIFDYIDLYDSNVVLVFCYMEYDKDAQVKEIDRATKRVFKLINRYGETLTNKDHGNNLLNKLLLEGRIVFRELLSEAIFLDEEIKKLIKKYEFD